VEKRRGVDEADGEADGARVRMDVSGRGRTRGEGAARDVGEKR
jgi:hypothetical protein